MPLINGFEATRIIREKEQILGTQPTTIIALTAHTLHNELQACFASGMDTLLLKPITLEKLSLSLHEHMDSKE
jgi:CheY-like chemotaxis protein